jgi:2-haloacid dehalogenase
LHQSAVSLDQKGAIMVQAVLFDIGNVLVGWNPYAVYDDLIGVERRKAFFEAVPMFKENERIDMGDPFSDVVASIAERYPDWHPEIEIWQTKWADMVSPVIDHSVRLLRALRAKGVPVFALSNFGDQTFDMAQERYPFLTEFDRAYVSGRLKMIKPYPDIYAHVEQDCGIAPADLLFTDDLPANIETARSRGWQTHLFQGPQGWAECLVRHGILSQEDAV